MLERVTAHPDHYEPALISQAIRLGDLVFVSGQPGTDQSGQLVDGFKAQGEHSFMNLKRVLEAGGSSLDRVVKVTIFVTDMANFPDVVELRRKYFSAPYPADSILEVSALYHPDAMIEIEAIASTL